MNYTYTPEEFARCYSLRGYGRKKDALAWMQVQCMDAANDTDFERCFHDLNQEQITARGCKWIAMRIDGTISPHRSTWATAGESRTTPR